ncbi:MAG: hypothetical protein QOF49_1989 [Chloroflexota bacterium]|nr:hypothetical protein [Chloroflexota bacterium]
MDTNLAAWMIAGGPRTETHASERERQQLHAFRESQRVARVARPSVIERIRAFARTSANPTTTDAACCPA